MEAPVPPACLCLAAGFYTPGQPGCKAGPLSSPSLPAGGVDPPVTSDTAGAPRAG